MSEKNLGEDKRKSRRIEYFSKISCTKYLYAGKETEPLQPLEMMLINISASGLGIIADFEFENSTILVLDILLEEILYKNVSARVIWSTKKGDSYRYGLEICRISGRLFTHLSKLDNSVEAKV